MSPQTAPTGVGGHSLLAISGSEWILHTLVGLSFGLLLFLVASGFTLTFGLARFVNLSHGATFMVAAHVAASIVGDVDGIAGFVAAVLVAAAVGVVLSLLVLGLAISRWSVVSGDPTKQVLLTFGLLLAIADLVRRQWDGIPQSAMLPSGLDGTILIGNSTFPVYRLGVIAAAILLAGALWWLTEKTRFGAYVRAGVDDREQLEALGVRPQILYVAVFGLAGALAGLSGGLGAPILGASVGQEFSILIFALIAVVIGGLGSLTGAFLASILVGLVDAYGKAVLPQFASFTIMILVVAVLALRPNGLIARGVA